MPAPTADGPDIAHYQVLTGKPFDPTWRLFSHKCSEGAHSGDSTFPRRWRIMREADFRWRFAYHWLRTDSSIRDQAANVCARLDAEDGLLPGEAVQVDWETTPNIAVPTSLQCAELCDRINQHFGGLRSIVYSSDWLPDSPLDADRRGEFYEWREENPTYPYWHANYNTGTTPTGGWAECDRYDAAIWQYSSAYKHPSIVSGRYVNGILVVSPNGGGFDINHVFKPDVLDSVTQRTAVPTPTPTPTPQQPIAPVTGSSGEKMLYCYIDDNGTVWIGNGIARRALDSMDTFAQYVFLAGTGGGPMILTANGVRVTGIDNVARVGAATIEALGKPI